DARGHLLLSVSFRPRQSRRGRANAGRWRTGAGRPLARPTWTGSARRVEVPDVLARYAAAARHRVDASRRSGSRDPRRAGERPGSGGAARDPRAHSRARSCRARAHLRTFSWSSPNRSRRVLRLFRSEIYRLRRRWMPLLMLLIIALAAMGIYLLIYLSVQAQLQAVRTGAIPSPPGGEQAMTQTLRQLQPDRVQGIG